MCLFALCKWEEGRAREIDRERERERMKAETVKVISLCLLSVCLFVWVMTVETDKIEVRAGCVCAESKECIRLVLALLLL